MHALKLADTMLFLSTLSLRRATHCHLIPNSGTFHFYPRSPCGERLRQRLIEFGKLRFLSTLSLRRATLSILIIGFSGMVFLSTLSLRRATCASPFSIFWICHFYPRSPCGERPSNQQEKSNGREFLSTLSLRRATRPAFFYIAQHTYFYPRSPCGERHLAARQ